jgi:phosphoribosylformimino-5-aminoimidazole carboxamide ribotide isomerase
MRILPVIDLLGNRTVHAVKGERAHYKPIRSVLCNTSDPLEVAGAFRDRLGLNEIYIADLDAIQNRQLLTHHNIIKNLASREKFDILLDSGISDIESISRRLELGIHKAVIGSETVTDWRVLEEIPAGTDRNRLVFSLDCRAGKIISKCRELASLSPLKALEHLHSSGWREIILLDLVRVGSGNGSNRSLAFEARTNFPDLTLFVGGGITGLEEIKELRSLGIDGVLVATILHQGIIGPQHLSALNRNL